MSLSPQGGVGAGGIQRRRPPFFVVTIPGEPVAQGRGKVGKWKARDGREGVTVRDPAKSRNWKAFAQARMEAALEEAGIPLPYAGVGEAVELTVVAYFTCPKSDHRKRFPCPRRPKLGRPDYDNLAKIVGDAGNGVLWMDDDQVFAGHTEKWIAAQGEAPRVEVIVRLPGREEPQFTVADLKCAAPATVDALLEEGLRHASPQQRVLESGLGIAEAVVSSTPVPRCVVCNRPKWLPVDGVWRCRDCDT